MEYIIKALVTKISIKAGQILIQLDDECCHEDINIYQLKDNHKETEKCFKYMTHSKNQLIEIQNDPFKFIMNHMNEKFTFICEIACENEKNSIKIIGVEWERYK